MTGFDAAVVGAGVIGVTTAYQLRRAGLSVALIERHAEPGSETSFANGGLITPSMSDPWASPGLPSLLLRSIGREDSPFLIRPRALPSLARWGYRFVRNCTHERWRANARRIFDLARFSQQCLAELMRDERLDCHLSSTGSLRLFHDQASMDKANRTADLMRELGIVCRAVGTNECTAIEPALAQLGGTLHGGLYYPHDQSGDCRAFTEQLAAVCARMDVHVFRDTEVARIEAVGSARLLKLHTNAAPIAADNVVLATAEAPPGLVPRSVLRGLLIYRVKGYSVTLSTEGLASAPRTALIDDARKVGISRLGDRLRAVGTAEFCGNDPRATPDRIADLLRSAAALMPELQRCRVESRWAGLRPMTPDCAPYIGALSQRGVFVNIGHGHLGWTNACGAAALIRDLVCGTRPSLDAMQFAPR